MNSPFYIVWKSCRIISFGSIILIGWLVIQAYKYAWIMIVMCPSRRLINNLADISDKAIPVKRRDRKNGHHSNTWSMDQSVLINNNKREETSKVILQSSVLSAHDSDGPQTTNDWFFMSSAFVLVHVLYGCQSISCIYGINLWMDLK